MTEPFGRDGGHPTQRWTAGELATLAALSLLAAVLMFWGLGRPYLWQDEAATAVLSERLMRFGKPLGYDGRNLITMDYALTSDLAALPILAGDPRGAVAYHVAKGDFKEDTSWIGQPWGQFVAAGLSLAACGKGTVAARAPFAAASVLTVVALFLLLRTALRDRLVAALAAALLLANPYWVLHGRQCRYYALSGLFELLTVAAFARWQRGGRFGGALLAASAWCWFQCDFGAFWPGTAILLLLGAVTRPGPRGAARVGVAVAVTVAPFVLFYRLIGRVKAPWESWTQRFVGLLFDVNQFVVPLAVLIAVAAAVMWRRKTLAPNAAGLLAACGAIVAAAPPWFATVGPSHYHRYVVHLTPLACILAAWGTIEAATWLARASGRPWLRPVAAGTLGAFVALSPAASRLLSWALPIDRTELYPLGTWLRPEIGLAAERIFGHRPDPNREAIDLVTARARPDDEILVSYEDIPFMFYTDNRIRGGISAFRVRDRSAPPPRFLVARPSVPFVPWSVFVEEMERYRWDRLPTQAPDIYWGNNPDPFAQWLWLRTDLPKIVVAERIVDSR